MRTEGRGAWHWSQHIGARIEWHNCRKRLGLSVSLRMSTPLMRAAIAPAESGASDDDPRPSDAGRIVFGHERDFEGDGMLR